VLVCAAHAQTVTGRIAGTVQDTNGAPIGSAQVAVLNQQTGLRWSCVTDIHGIYGAASLPSGSYRIQVTAPGFRSAISLGVEVAVAQTTRADFTLQLGIVTEVIEVTGISRLVESTTSSLGQSVGRDQAQALPLNGRIFSQLVMLAPGTVAAGPADSPEGASGAGARSPIGASVNGLPWSGTSYMMDGVINKEPQNAFINIAPPVEAIEEFKVQTNNPAPEFGFFGGAIVNLTMRSGTNSFHGSAFDYARNSDLNARNFFAPSRAVYQSSQFGGTAGGRIMSNRIFFFADYQGLRLRNGQTFTLNVPTPNMRQGVFSAAEGFGALFDPDAGAAPFPGNRIPANRFDPVSARAADLWPLPNAGGSAPAANYVQNVAQRQQVDQGDVKGDVQATQRVRLFARESYDHRLLAAPSPGNRFIGAGQENAESWDHNAVIGYTHVIGGRTISELRLGFNRFNTFHFGNDYGVDENNALGIRNGNLAAFPESSGIATFNVNGIQATGSPLSTNGLRAAATYQLTEGVSIVNGRHTVKAGIDTSRTDATVTNPEANPRGQFDFDSSLTSSSGLGGAAFASFLLGYPSAITRGFVNTRPVVTTYMAGIYLQDDYRLSRTLTLNIGLRWELFTHPRERFNRQTNFNLGDGLLHSASPGDTGPGLANFAGLAPRAGLAYSPDGGRTAFRAAFGISAFNDNFGANGGSLERNFPLFETFILQKQQNFTPFAKVSVDGLPGFTPVALTPKIVPAAGITPIAIPNDFRPDEAMMWNAGIQRRITDSDAVDAAYVGTRGIHLFRDRLINAPLSPGPGDINSRRPYYTLDPQIQAIRLRASDGNSIYHSLQARYTHRLARGLTMVASYTWAKSIDDQNVIWPYDDRMNRGVSNSKSSDVRHSFSAGYSYELPHGESRWRRLMEGWRIDGVTAARTGLPLVVSVATPLLNTGTANRANLVCSSVALPKLVSQWFDTSCFTAPAPYVFGNSGKGHVRGPGLLNFDVSATRRFRLGEKGALEFRAEFFNASNTAHFANPQTTLGNADFGRITSTILTPREIQLGTKYSF
jgi:hypothetical protein